MYVYIYIYIYIFPNFNCTEVSFPKKIKKTTLFFFDQSKSGNKTTFLISGGITHPRTVRG